MRWRPERTFLDHILGAAGASMAAWCGCISIGSPEGAQFFAIAIWVAAFAGYGVSRLIGKNKLIAADAWLLFVVAMFCFVNVVRLNGMISPDLEREPTTVTSTFLCWLMLAGSLFAWRDQTLLFLNIPSLALFGLLGVFDNYRLAVFFFFCYLVCSAVLYARVHQRDMIERAARVGASDLRLLRGGAWKWMAGPEWALASALVIVLISIAGAPVIRATVQPVAGTVRVNWRPPQINQQNSTSRQSTSTTYPVGRGPINVSNTPVMTVKVDDPNLYFRTTSYSTYTGRGWSQLEPEIAGTILAQQRRLSDVSSVEGPNGGVIGWPPNGMPPTMEIDNHRMVEFTIGLIQGVPAGPIPTPGPVSEVIHPSSGITFTAMGDAKLDVRQNAGGRLRAVAIVTNDSGEGHEAVLPRPMRPLEGLYHTRKNLPANMVERANEITQGVSGDYAKAMAIKRYIEGRCVYNLNAERAPADADVVSWFLDSSRQGYCDLFASSMTVLARGAGLPARYVLGYIFGDAEKDKEGYYTVREKDFHAWCEIYFEGVGWVVFDPTEGARAVEGAGVGSLPDDGVRLIDEPWFRQALMIATASLAGLSIVIYLIGNLRQFVRSGSIVHGELSRHHARFIKMMERYVRSPKRFSQTTAEYVSAHLSQLVAAGPAAQELTKGFERAMFGPNDLSGHDVRSLGKQVSDFHAQLRQVKKSGATTA